MRTTDAAAIVTRLRRVEAELALEKQRRLQVEQRAAGLTSAVRRLSTMLAKSKVEAAEHRPTDC